MIDLHTHTFLSDGVLIPSELVRRAQVAGYRAIALTDHVDSSNIEVVLRALVKVSHSLNKYWDITVLPGVEITHVPLEMFEELVSFARENGAKIVVAHGESPVEPVLPGTNSAAISAEVDILAHPGRISDEDVILAAEKGVHLELTTRKGHCETNSHVFEKGIKAGAPLVINTDCHAPDDLLSQEKINDLLGELTDSDIVKDTIRAYSESLVSAVTNGRQ